MMIETINFRGNIDDNLETTAFMDKCESILNDKSNMPDRLVVSISSIGGDVGLAVDIYKVLRGISEHTYVETHNGGSVESSAVIIFLAGDIRIANVGTYFLLHGLWRSYDNDINKLNCDIERYAAIFEKRTRHAKDIIDIRQILNDRHCEVRVDWRSSFDYGLTTLYTEISDPVHCNGQYII